MELRTARLVLRRARPSDLGAIHEILSDPRAMRYWSTLPHETLAQSAAYLNDMLVAAPDRDLFIVEQAGRVIGRVGMWKQPEVGFILHPDSWGRGFGYEAMHAFIAHAFATHDIPEMTADADPHNEASLGLLRKLGFVETGRAERTFLIGGEWFDSVYLALRRPS